MSTMRGKSIRENTQRKELQPMREYKSIPMPYSHKMLALQDE
jgi:hypothetical protein